MNPSIIFILLLTTTQAVHSALYGEPCLNGTTDPNLQCEPDSSLTCADQDGANICVCTSRSLPNHLDGKCSGGYDASCLIPETGAGSGSCNHDRHLRCYTLNGAWGMCQCDGTFSQVYSYETQSCVALAAAKCEPGATPPFGLTCAPHSSCTPWGTCRCDPGYTPTVYRKCVKIGGN